MKKKLWIYFLVGSAFLFFSNTIQCQESKSIKLPPPQMDIGRPLMKVLKERHSTREFSEKKLSEQDLSNLLWAAFGINRPDSKKRTAPSALNRQEIDIYVATEDGLFIYDPDAHGLTLVSSQDIRHMTGLQPYVKDAPVNLVYVGDLAKMDGIKEADQKFYSAANTGFIGQNVYLYCASEGLGTVIRGSIDREALSKMMNLKKSQHIILAQCVGYPRTGPK